MAKSFNLSIHSGSGHLTITKLNEDGTIATPVTSLSVSLREGTIDQLIALGVPDTATITPIQ